jgi:3-deoxy-manno-octulosonate cytidylyltransferase (CMP-KDO synthetase)
MRRISKQEAGNSNNVKVVTDRSGFALYFSRSMIPCLRDEEIKAEYFLHIGVYAYKKDTLIKFTQWPPSRLEKTEKLEQLRYLENGIKIKMAETNYDNIAIDTPEDLERAKEIINSR